MPVVRRKRRGTVSLRAGGRIAAWLALAACLLQFLTPLAWATARGTSDPLAGALLICTPDGFRSVDAAGDEVPAKQKSHRPFCPACATVAHGILPPHQEFVPAALPRAVDPLRPAQERVAGHRPPRLNSVRAPPLA